MGEEYIKTITRWESLFDIRAWLEGESRELKKWLGVGLFKTLFVSQNGVVMVYYDKQEGETFYNKLKETLTDEFFDRLCDDFLNSIEQIDTVNSNKEIYKLIVKMWPVLTIFDEISKYPEIASQTILNRLMRIRKNTESLSYELSKKVKLKNQPKDFIVINGKLYL